MVLAICSLNSPRGWLTISPDSLVHFDAATGVLATIPFYDDVLSVLLLQKKNRLDSARNGSSITRYLTLEKTRI
jgi:hypothetical protein